MVDGDCIAPQGIAAHFADRSRVDGENIRTGGTAEVNAVVCLPCTGGLGFHQLAVAEGVENGKIRQRRCQLVHGCFFRFCLRCSRFRCGLRGSGLFCSRRCSDCCLCLHCNVCLHADHRCLIRQGSSGRHFHLFAQRVEILFQGLAGLTVRKDTGCADHDQAQGKCCVKSTEFGFRFCLGFHANHLRC